MAGYNYLKEVSTLFMAGYNYKKKCPLSSWTGYNYTKRSVCSLHDWLQLH